MQSSTQKLKRTAMIVAILGLIIWAFEAQSQKPAPKIESASKTGKKQLEPWEAWEKYREEMIVISRQLGVTCVYCHDSRNYRDSSKKTHQIAKAHMEMVDMINDKFKNSFSAKIDCYSCHKGVAKPEYKEKPGKI
jgi:hypothetical protein